MAISWINGITFQAPEGGPGTPISVTLNGVTPGNCLIASVGRRSNLAIYSGLMHPADNKQGVWLPPITSPAQTSSSEGADFQLCTFVSPLCPGGDINITFYETEHFGAYAISIDEYSGISAAFPIGPSSFASTPYGSGITGASARSIVVPSGYLIYSAAHGLVNPLNFTPSSGFTQRHVVEGNLDYPISLACWDKISSGGVYSNEVTVDVDPNTLHVTLLALSPTTIDRPIIQYGAYSLSGADVEEVDTTFPYPNVAGNTLIAVGKMYERSIAQISDINNNNWEVVYNDGIGDNPPIVMAYCNDCKPGVNTVRMNSLSGGTDDDMMLIVGEYPPQQAFTASSDSGAGNYAQEVDTGNIGVSKPTILFSMYTGNSINSLGQSAAGPVSQLGTVRYQFSISGHFTGNILELALADQVVSGPGSYNNIFSISPDSATLAAGILGFIVKAPTGPTGPPCKSPVPGFAIMPAIPSGPTELAVVVNEAYPNRIQLTLGVLPGPWEQNGPLGSFDPRRDLEVYVDGQFVPIQSYQFDSNSDSYLISLVRQINLHGVIQVVHHMPSPPFLDSISCATGATGSM